MTLEAQHADEDKTISIMKIAMDKNKSLAMAIIVATLLYENVRMKLTFSKWGLGSPLGLPKL
jgi:hypothetical protein